MTHFAAERAELFSDGVVVPLRHRVGQKWEKKAHTVPYKRAELPKLAEISAC